MDKVLEIGETIMKSFELYHHIGRFELSDELNARKSRGVQPCPVTTMTVIVILEAMLPLVVAVNTMATLQAWSTRNASLLSASQGV